MFAENQNLPFQPEQVRQVLGSPAGKKLLQLLTQDGGAALQQAAARLKAGDTARGPGCPRPVPILRGGRRPVAADQPQRPEVMPWSWRNNSISCSRTRPK